MYNLYFSPTGGTRRAGEAVASAWDAVQRVDFFRDARGAADLALQPTDVVLVSVPCFGGRVPKVAVRRLKKLRGNGAAAILQVVYGNRSPGDALPELRDVLQAADLRPLAAIAAVAEHSLCREYAAGRPDAADQAVLRGMGEKIRQALETGTLTRCPALPGNPDYGAEEDPEEAWEPTELAPYGTDRCNGCGRCAEQCPVKAIPEEDPRRTNGYLCFGCMHCVTVCPQHARKLVDNVQANISAMLAAEAMEPKENRLYL